MKNKNNRYKLLDWGSSIKTDVDGTVAYKDHIEITTLYSSPEVYEFWQSGAKIKKINFNKNEAYCLGITIFECLI